MFADGNLTGQKALPELAQEMASNEDWKDVDSEEKERLIVQLREHKAQKQEKKVTKVPDKFAANDIETTMNWLDGEVS